jgi:hypothetical protein
MNFFWTFSNLFLKAILKLERLLYMSDKYLKLLIDLPLESLLLFEDAYLNHFLALHCTLL